MEHTTEHEKLCAKIVTEIVSIFLFSHLSLWKDGVFSLYLTVASMISVVAALTFLGGYSFS